MSKHKQKQTNKLQIQISLVERQKIALFLGTVAILGLSFHIKDVVYAVNSGHDVGYGVNKAVDDHHHVHSGDMLIDRRNIAQYNSEEKSTSAKDRDNWEVYENAMGFA